ncbi:DUF554 domain-containing protein [Athalassotoga saccharophila]|uniref:DUF554 domain-containing protein n=1 Tax=Athalassotoga saccharophila TaxID=1441386 RepID=UPI00137A8877|nr:DUF554 domain-containing protein [Athalassotoga saccharophila]BBJ27308.1 putative membrane protein YdfK [Athalassotoga saccharophila]
MLSLGVIVNTLTVIGGTLIGIPLGNKLKEKHKSVFFISIGILTILIGVSMGLKTENFLVVLGSLVIGGLIGEIVGIEDKISNLSKKFSKRDSNFATGFISTTVLFVVGPMTILGCVNSGLTGNNEILYVKSIMDGISSIAFASVYGIGVLMSAGSVFVIEGGLALLASFFQFLTLPAYLNDFTGTGGAMMLMIGLRILNVKEIKVGNFLPALIVAPLIDFFIVLFH